MSLNPEATLPRLERAAFIALATFVAALQVSIALANILLTVTGVLWVALLIKKQERVTAPQWFWLLPAYAALTLMSAVMSLAPVTSIIDSKQLLLFLIVPGVYRLARGQRAITIATVIISVGAASAIIGIAQYGIFEYDNLGRRPQGSLTHYMTYSGLLMLVSGMAAARLLFHGRDRTWPALVMPALLAALALTFTRSAMVGTCVGIGLLLAIKDLRLLLLAPIVAGLFTAVAPEQITARLYSTFDPQNETVRDRIAMMRTGVRLVRDYPLMGVGPDMVEAVYVDYRDPAAVQESNPHLHNVPIQIAAERGIPALLVWIALIVAVTRGLVHQLRTGAYRSLPAGGLAAVGGMLAAGMFEYNFGDSEFLMLWLVLVTLPFAAEAEPITSDQPTTEPA
ncbi:MAG: O-antigen ligase family protein [Acidobacteriota bacterium]|nr:O-antigen ligase family protein [Acidobacteriota bacterium]MEE3138754.1 O-antigen ligase family protein [Acidobacteriota bacterium]